MFTNIELSLKNILLFKTVKGISHGINLTIEYTLNKCKPVNNAVQSEE